MNIWGDFLKYRNLISFIMILFIINIFSIRYVSGVEANDSKSSVDEVRLLVTYDNINLKSNDIQDPLNVYKDSKSISSTEIFSQILNIENKCVNTISVEKRETIDLVILKNGIDTKTIINKLKNTKGVKSVEHDFELEIFESSNDPYYSKQWYLEKNEMNKVWKLIGNRGESVVVAVMDSGVDVDHEDLDGRIELGGYNFGENNSFVNDYQGHGTAVSGVIGAEINNEEGIAGVTGASNITILPLKIEDDLGRMYVSYAIKAIEYAIEKKVDILNISSGSAQYSDAYNNVLQKAIDNGITIIASAGNYGHKENPIYYPASYDRIISVGAINKYDEVPYFSEHNQYIDVVAPGENIMTTIPNNRYIAVSGTSFSAPFVSAVAAMLKSLDKRLEPDDIRALLISTSKDLGTIGKDNYYGYGRVDPLKAITKVLTDLREEEILKEHWSEWPNKETNDLNKIWTIQLNQKVEVASIKEDTIFVVDENNKKIEIFMKFEEGGKNILIEPKVPYEIGKTYSLYIFDSLKNEIGNLLENPVKMKFNIIE